MHFLRISVRLRNSIFEDQESFTVKFPVEVSSKNAFSCAATRLYNDKKHQITVSVPPVTIQALALLAATHNPFEKLFLRS